MTKANRQRLIVKPIQNVTERRNVLSRLVVATENGGRKEATLVRESTGRRRVIVGGGNATECSMELEREVLLEEPFVGLDHSRNVMCWANFRESNNPALCILSAPTLVMVFDVDSSFLAGGEGHAIHLPCQADSIFPLRQGILIQRMVTSEDHTDYLPHHMQQAKQAVSLFSVAHPLDPVLPIEGSHIFEKVVYVHSDQRKQLCVTYNIKVKRHAVWWLQATTPAPPPTPLWQMRDQSDLRPYVVDSDLLVTEDASLYDGVTSRQEALADALGVRRPQTNTMIATAPSAPILSLHPDFSMTLLYETLPLQDMAISVFCQDMSLCIAMPNVALVLQLGDQVHPLVKIPCKAAVPVGKTDFLTLSPSNELQLYRKGQYVCDFAFQDNVVPVALDHPVRNTFEVRCVGGASFRCRLPLDFVENPLCEYVMSVVDETLEPAVAVAIRLACAGIVQNLGRMHCGNTAWYALSSVISAVLEGGDRGPHEYRHEMFSQPDFPLPSDGECDFSSLPELSVANLKVSPLPDFAPLDLGEVTEAISATDDAAGVQRVLFDLLHLVYEEVKLSTAKRKWLIPIGVVLLRYCTINEMTDYIEHYRRDGINQSMAKVSSPTSTRSREPMAVAKPPCVMTWVDRRMRGQAARDEFRICDLFPRTRLVHRTFLTLFPLEQQGLEERRDAEVIGILLEEGIENAAIIREDFPVGVALPLMDVLSRCRVAPSRLDHLHPIPHAAWHLVGREDMRVEGCKDSDGCREVDATALDDKDRDGLELVERASAMLYPDDNRLREVGRLLRSSRPIFLKVPRAVEVSDHDYERIKQERLLVLSRRTLALPLGRGMFTFGGLSPLPAEPLPVPGLCLSGRVPPTNNPLALDMSNCASNVKMWPEFHNGVAAGLRLAHADSLRNGHDLKISRAWIVYNRTSQNEVSSPPGTNSDGVAQTDNSHGGLLMALGLRGYLSALSMTDIYEYLTQGSVTTSVGVLLGMAANKRGTCDPSVSKMLCLHIPSLLPPSFTTIDVSGPARAAAVTGIGLLYQRSSHRLMTEFLLNEMGCRPVHDSNTVDRESYNLSCGLALGMVNLAPDDGNSRGTTNAGLADLEIDLRLHRFVVGGVDLREQRRQKDPINRFSTVHGVSSEGERCSRVYEGNHINNHVTAPGATLALGLIYLKSGNRAIASNLALPDTHFLLEYVRPDFMMLRVIARAMILWDDVEPTSGWIDAQVPKVVQESLQSMAKAVKRKSEVGSAGQSDPALDVGDDVQQTQRRDRDIDRQAVRQIHSFVVAGSCFGIGLRFAGTADERAQAAITERVMTLNSYRDGNDSLSLALRPDHTVVEMCLGLCALSLGMVMAGSGNLQCLRLFKLLRWRCDDTIRYGSHMAYSAAIGLLFLGGGTCTLGRSNQDIVALVAAFFPRFPAKTSDNLYHLQALRHLYALAVHQRELQILDWDSRKKVAAEAELMYEDHDELRTRIVRTPCALLNSDFTLKGLKVRSDLFYSRAARLDSNERSSGIRLFVKRRQHWMGDGDRRPLSIRQSDSNVPMTDESMRFTAFKKHLEGGQDTQTRGQHDNRWLFLDLSRSTESNHYHRRFWDTKLLLTYLKQQNCRDEEQRSRAQAVASIVEQIEQDFLSRQSAEDFQAWYDILLH